MIQHLNLSEMQIFNNLTHKEIEALIKYPAYISMLAASIDDTLDDAEKKAAIEFAHTKVYSSNPLLTEFYKEADKVFRKNIEQLENDLPKEKKQRERMIKKELSKIEAVVRKLDEEYIIAMHHSMRTFKDHVSEAHHNVLVDFIFPVPIHGLNDRLRDNLHHVREHI